MVVLRCLLCACACFIAQGWTLAADPAAPSPIADQAAAGQSPKILPSNNEAKPVVALTGRKKLEAQLQMSANLDFGDRHSVTVKEMFDQLHVQHQLSIRFDAPILTSLLSETAVPASPTGPATSAKINNSQQHAPPAPIADDTTAAKQVSTAAPISGPINSPNAVNQLFSTLEVDIQNVDMKHVSVATVLRLTLDAVPANSNAALDDDLEGLPILLTNATLLDYVVEDDGLLITPRMNALLLKETRVYSVKHLKDYTPEQLANVIRFSIRPWSWRSQINDLGEQLKTNAVAVPPGIVTALMKTGVQMASAETGVSVDAGNQPDDQAATKKDGQDAAPHDSATNEANVDAADLAALGHALVNGFVTVAQASLSVLEMFHYAEPPTGTIQTLPGKLIITQSQAAHREIADLLKQLSDE